MRHRAGAQQPDRRAVLLGPLPPACRPSSAPSPRIGWEADSVMSMCVRYAGDSYRYLLDSVTTDHGRAGTSPMTRYYTATGTPPGTWLGAGLAGLASGVGLPAGSFVTPRHMERLFRDAPDPSTGASLGRSTHLYSPASKGQRRRPVAGFDCTFTVPKSVSVLWALADDGTREVLDDAHRAALNEVL